jgi:hypothetical protein
MRCRQTQRTVIQAGPERAGIAVGALGNPGGDERTQ